MTPSAPATDTRVVVFARAPEPGAAKTRLIPLLGADGAAALQGVLLDHALTTAIAADIGRVELWCAPSAQHPLLSACLQRHGIDGVSQCEGDLGARMQHAAAATLAAAARVIIIGADCPALTADDLRAAAAALDGHHDAVLIPAEDGGYVLIGLKWWDARLFSDIVWGGDQVLAATRARLAALQLALARTAAVMGRGSPRGSRALARERTDSGSRPRARDAASALTAPRSTRSSAAAAYARSSRLRARRPRTADQKSYFLKTNR